MQTFSNVVKSLMAKDEVAIFFLVNYDSSLFTSLPYPVSISGMAGLNLYSPDPTGGSGLLSLEPPRMSSSVDKASYKVTIADPSFEFRSKALAGNVGAKLEVRFGFFNTFPNTIVDSAGAAVVSGAPLLNIDDTFIIYSGYASSQTYAVDFNGTSTFVVEGTSPFGALDNIKAYYTTKNFITSRFPEVIEDTAYDKVHDGSVETRVKWGKT